jgi:hypothetical protein
MKPPRREVASSGHLLGQLIGDWWERYVIKPLLDDVAGQLDLFADSRFVQRSCRGEKIQWEDLTGNRVDYDFVLELGGTHQKRGTPVAFMESFWRRGARHSKDKARDDTNKLLPMLDTYPTARFAAIAACGEFTEPARDYVRSRNVNLFFVPKSNIISAFSEFGLQIDYLDSAAEDEKRRIAQALQYEFTDEMCKNVAAKLRDVVGHSSLASFSYLVSSSLSAHPQEITIREAAISDPVKFKTVQEASDFLEKPEFTTSSKDSSYSYSIVYSDGSEFSRHLGSIEKLKSLHNDLLRLVTHMENVTRTA